MALRGVRGRRRLPRTLPLSNPRDFQDYFSSVAAQYREFRPRYPSILVDVLAEHCTQRELAWDAGCGSGQLTTQLSRLFTRVIGTDPSPEQIAQAKADLPETITDVEYILGKAELPMLQPRSVDLAVSAQAAHYFVWPRYVAEVERVTRPGAVVALVSYGILTLAGEAGEIVGSYYHDIAGPFWPPERRHVENGYRDFEWPWAPITSPVMDMTADWTREELLGYIATWSATSRLIAARGPEPYQQLCGQLAQLWPDDVRRTVTWPLAIRMAHRS